MDSDKMGKKRIHGNDRGFMMLARDVRRRWLQYGENRVITKGEKCQLCPKPAEEVDHVYPVGKRPRTSQEFGAYIERMFYGECRPLCRKCNQDWRKRKDK